MQQIVVSIMDYISQHTQESAPPSVSKEKHDPSPPVETSTITEEECAPLASQDDDAQSMNIQRYLHTDTPVPEHEEEAKPAETTEVTPAETTEVKEVKEVKEEEEKVKPAEMDEEDEEEKNTRFLLTLAPDTLAFSPSTDTTHVPFFLSHPF